MDEPTGKRCTKCGEDKPLEEFYRRGTTASSRDSQCKDCRKESARRRYTDDPAAAREIAARARKANPNGALESARRQHAANRMAVLDHYGRSCACCGITKRLGIDHVNGDGKEHRAQIGMGSSHLYRWLVANGFPGGFQVLCGWCNHSKADGERCRLDHQAA